jgi:hypothetical protein
VTSFAPPIESIPTIPDNPFPVTPNPDMGSNQPFVELPPPTWDSPPFNR